MKVLLIDEVITHIETITVVTLACSVSLLLFLFTSLFLYFLPSQMFLSLQMLIINGVSPGFLPYKTTAISFLLLRRCGLALCCLSLSSSSSLIVFIATLTLLLPCLTFSSYDRFCLSLQLLFPHPQPSSLQPLFPLLLPKSIYAQLFKLCISLLFSSLRFFPPTMTSHCVSEQG